MCCDFLHEFDHVVPGRVSGPEHQANERKRSGMDDMGQIMGQMKEWTLDRGLQQPISFTGELIIYLDGTGQRSLWQSLVGGGRWHSLSVFRTREGRWVVYITFRTRVQGELDNREAFWCDQPAHLPAVFAQYQQVAFPVLAARMVGNPASSQRNAIELMARYQRQVAQILSAIPAAMVKIG